MRKLVYVAGPYTAPSPIGKLRNVCRAVDVAKQIMIDGNIPVIPHKITELWDLDWRFADWGHEEWLTKYCFPLLARCDAITFVEGWEKSKGACAELAYAQINGIEILGDIGQGVGIG